MLLIIKAFNAFSDQLSHTGGGTNGRYVEFFKVICGRYVEFFKVYMIYKNVYLLMSICDIV